MFYDVVLKFQKNLHWSPNFIINVDEIRFQENRNGSFVRLLTSRDGTKTIIKKIRSSRGMTVIPFITANGTTLLVVYILPWMSKKKVINLLEKFFILWSNI